MVSQYFGFLLVHKQWGILTQESQETCTFPIALSQVLCCFCIAHAPNTNSSSYVYGGRVKSYTTTTITTFVDSYRQSISGWWLVFGKQQWGYATGPGSPWTITFPITFSSAESYAANSTPAYTESLGSQYCFKNASWTNTSITVFSSNKTTFRTYWFVIGY